MHAEHLDPSDLHPETLVVAAGRPSRELNAPVNEPVHFSSTFHSTLPDTVPDQRFYGRMANPSWEGAEVMLAQLEQVTQPDTHPGLLFSSGMAAIAAALHTVHPGGRVLFPRHAYNGGVSLAQQLHAAQRITLEQIDITDDAALTAAYEKPVALLWLESPTNPSLEVVDLAALIDQAHAHGALTAVDNTFATPLVQQPLTLGADIVVHSMTKYLAGHSDVVLGAVVTNHSDLHAQLRTHRTQFGGIAGPMEAFLALRGMRTLALRVERSMDTAAELARRLYHWESEGQLAPGAVRYPGLPSHEQHNLAATTMSGGFGAVLTVDVGDEQRADAVVKHLRLWTPATSLGGVESLIERRRRFASEPETVPAGLLRLSVGIEHVEDLWDDLHQALRAAGVLTVSDS